MSESTWYDLEEVEARPRCGDACEGKAYCKRAIACVWEGRIRLCDVPRLNYPVKPEGSR